MKKLSLAFLSLLSVIFLMAGTSKAAVRYVCHNGCEFSSIQEAVNGVNDGDTIHINEGTYYEYIEIIRGGKITIEGASSADPTATKLDGNYSHRIFYISPEKGPLVLTIKNLTVQNGRKKREDSQPSYNHGGGILAEAGCGEFDENKNCLSGYTLDLTLSNTVIRNNEAGGDKPERSYADGGGIAIHADYQLVTVTLENNEIYNNKAQWDSGGVLFAPYFENTEDNPYIFNVHNNYIHDNQQAYGGALHFFAGNKTHLEAYVTNNTITDNSAYQCFRPKNDRHLPAGNAGLTFRAGNGTVWHVTSENNTISRNRGGYSSGLLAKLVGTTPQIILYSYNDTITGNTPYVHIDSCPGDNNCPAENTTPEPGETQKMTGGGVVITIKNGKPNKYLEKQSVFTFVNAEITHNSISDLQFDGRKSGEFDERKMVKIYSVNSNIGTMRRYCRRDLCAPDQEGPVCVAQDEIKPGYYREFIKYLGELKLDLHPSVISVILNLLLQ